MDRAMRSAEVIVAEVQPLPPAPDDWIMRLEPKMTNPRIRLGLALLAIGGLMGAIFIFALPNTKPRKSDEPDLDASTPLNCDTIMKQE